MTLFRTVEPVAEPLTLSEVKAQLRIDHASEDEFLAGLIRAAREEVENTAGVAMIDQSWRLALDDWPENGIVLLRRAPVKTILSVTVFDADGAASIIDPADYQLDPHAGPARLYLRHAPEIGQPLNGVEVDFTAGFGAGGPDVPDLLKRAMLMLVGHWYEFRAHFGACDQPVSLPMGYQRLVEAYRTPRL